MHSDSSCVLVSDLNSKSVEVWDSDSDSGSGPDLFSDSGSNSVSDLGSDSGSVSDSVYVDKTHVERTHIERTHTERTRNYLETLQFVIYLHVSGLKIGGVVCIVRPPC